MDVDGGTEEQEAFTSGEKGKEENKKEEKEKEKKEQEKKEKEEEEKKEQEKKEKEEEGKKEQEKKKGKVITIVDVDDRHVKIPHGAALPTRDEKKKVNGRIGKASIEAKRP